MLFRLPALKHKHSLRRSLASFNYNLVLRNVFVTICGAGTTVFPAFVLAQGVPGEIMGRFAMMGALGGIFQMLVLPRMARIQDRKKFVIRAGIVEPTMLALVVVLAPFLPLVVLVGALLLTTFLQAAFINMTRPIQDDWLASTVPEGIRGRFLGRRQQFESAVMIGSLIATGIAADHINNTRIDGLALLLLVGAAFGIASVVVLRHADLPRTSVLSSVNLTDVPRVFAYRPYRRFVAAVVLFNLPFNMIGAFQAVFDRQELRMTVTAMSMKWVLYYIGRMAASRMWGTLLHRWGARRLIFTVVPIYICGFFIISQGQVDRWWPVFGAWVLYGVADSAWGVATNASLFGVVPSSGNRPAYFAVFNLLNMAMAIPCVALGEAVIRLLGDTSVTMGPTHMGPYHLLEIFAGLLIIPSCLGILLLPRRDEKS